MKTMKLWSAREPTRWFLVPDDDAWPTGTDQVFDVLERARPADLAALAAFEVEAAVARDWARGETGRIEASLGPRPPSIRAAVREQGRQAAAGIQLSEEQQQELQDGLRAMGFDLDRLDDSQAVADLFTDIVAGASKASRGGDPEGILRAVQDTLRAHGHPGAAERVPQLRKVADDLMSWLDELSAQAPEPE